ncbi:uncharacterized protein BDZ99DRAFT_466695 [Mytilinidion resinicola]|uniref:Uncharacterized protein n=1 Tax=Mytilinidion resinicola TaxID=574789 RepID=A0A6A6Y852_9PEZI|nr:uncharacterized protein BDZ99DRAFT_466695 [Mytilinidion resinicola]KAF2805016.1 hypothetical protein BDZ99DRAFT_466695 [Mytilinidion resinicola]
MDQINEEMFNERVLHTMQIARERADCRRAYRRAQKLLQAQNFNTPSGRGTGMSRKDSQVREEETSPNTSSDNNLTLGTHVPKGPGAAQIREQESSTTGNAGSERALGTQVQKGSGNVQSSRQETSPTSRSDRRKRAMNKYLLQRSKKEETVHSEKRVADTKLEPGFKILRIANT